LERRYFTVFLFFFFSSFSFVIHNYLLIFCSWTEIQLEEDFSAHYLKAKEMGLLPQQQMKKKMEAHQKPCNISSTTQEGFIKFGSNLMIFSELVDSFVSVDLDKKFDADFKERYQISCAKAKYPVQRSCFVIEKFVNCQFFSLILFCQNQALFFIFLSFQSPFKNRYFG